MNTYVFQSEYGFHEPIIDNKLLGLIEDGTIESFVSIPDITCKFNSTTFYLESYATIDELQKIFKQLFISNGMYHCFLTLQNTQELAVAA